MLEAIPVIEFFLVGLLRGNASVGQITLTQSLYNFVLHGLTIVFMVMHFPKILGSLVTIYSFIFIKNMDHMHL